MNYNELKVLYDKYRDHGFEVYAFPCNQFFGQEPGTNAEIQARIMEKWGPTWPTMAKVEVNGEHTHPVYKFLRSAALKNQGPDNNFIEWNFQKYLIDADGQVFRKYGPKVPPFSLDTPDKMQAWLKGENLRD